MTRRGSRSKKRDRSRNIPARDAPGWKPIARPKCGRLRTTRKIAAGAVTQLQVQSEAQKGLDAAHAARLDRAGLAYGNMAAAVSKDETKILREEMRALKCRSPLDSFGIWMLGPALLENTATKTEERAPAEDRARRNPLVPGLFGTGAAPISLALQTKAEDRGDHYLVNGSEDLDQLRRITPTGSSASCAPIFRRRSTKAFRSLVRHDDAGRHDQTDPADFRASRRSARRSSPT